MESKRFGKMEAQAAATDKSATAVIPVSSICGRVSITITRPPKQADAAKTVASNPLSFFCLFFMVPVDNLAYEATMKAVPSGAVPTHNLLQL